MNLSESETIVRSYVLNTHGSLPNIDYSAVSGLLSDDFQFRNEEQTHDKSTLLGSVFPGDILFLTLDSISSIKS